jgi:hypothetical protein
MTEGTKEVHWKIEAEHPVPRARFETDAFRMWNHGVNSKWIFSLTKLDKEIPKPAVPIERTTLRRLLSERSARGCCPDQQGNDVGNTAWCDDVVMTELQAAT